MEALRFPFLNTQENFLRVSGITNNLDTFILIQFNWQLMMQVNFRKFGYDPRVVKDISANIDWGLSKAT